jgi:hypothetical protein
MRSWRSCWKTNEKIAHAARSLLSLVYQRHLELLRGIAGDILAEVGGRSDESSDDRKERKKRANELFTSFSLVTGLLSFRCQIESLTSRTLESSVVRVQQRKQGCGRFCEHNKGCMPSPCREFIFNAERYAGYRQFVGFRHGLPFYLWFAWATDDVSVIHPVSAAWSTLRYASRGIASALRLARRVPVESIPRMRHLRSYWISLHPNFGLPLPLVQFYMHMQRSLRVCSSKHTQTASPLSKKQHFSHSCLRQSQSLRQRMTYGELSRRAVVSSPVGYEVAWISGTERRC